MGTFKIAVVAPGGFIAPEPAERVQTLASSAYPSGAVEIHFHPQCFLQTGHFAGDDETRARTLAEVANDPAVDAVWFARGGYGAARMMDRALALIDPAAARDKPFLGYSDCGVVLGALDKAGIGGPAHGPMPIDINRGEAAVLRALSWLKDRDPAALEPHLSGPTIAYNVAVLSSVLGTSLEPDFAGRVLMLEEVGEYMYRLDRYLAHITGSPAVRQAKGIKLGRISGVPENTPDFGRFEDDIMQEWCARSGIPYLGRADIGHDDDNKVVPFG